MCTIGYLYSIQSLVYSSSVNGWHLWVRYSPKCRRLSTIKSPDSVLQAHIMHALHTADLEAEIMAVYRFVVALYKEHGIDTGSNKSERKIERDPDGFTWVYSRTEQQRMETDGDIAKSSQSKCETKRFASGYRTFPHRYNLGITSTNHRRQCLIIQDLRISLIGRASYHQFRSLIWWQKQFFNFIILTLFFKPNPERFQRFSREGTQLDKGTKQQQSPIIWAMC